MLADQLWVADFEVNRSVDAGDPLVALTGAPGSDMRLPKPIYEALPYFLIGIGTLFVYLVLRKYEYAPTLFIWLLGIFCIVAGIALIVTRWMFRRVARQNAAADEDDD